MFDCLADQMRQDERLQVSGTERLVRRMVVALVSVLVFAGVYYTIQMLQ